MKKNIFIFIIILLCFTIKVNATEITLSNGTILKENFKTQFDNKLNGFLFNIKNIDDGYVMINEEEVRPASNNYIVKLDNSGNITHISSETDFYSGNSDVISTRDNYILTTDNEGENIGKIRVYDESLNLITTYNRTYYFSSTQNIYEYGDNYAIIGSSYCNNYTANCIVINELDSKGNLLETKSIETDLSIMYDTLGIYSSDKKVYILYKSGSNLKIAIVDDEYNYKSYSINTSNYEVFGLFTNILKYNNDIYFACSTGVYKIDNEYKLSKLYDGQTNNIDITSMIINDEYVIVGGVSPYNF